MSEGGDYKSSWCCWLASWQVTEIIWILPFICTHFQASFSWLVWKSVIACRCSVQTIVLKHEEDVKHHREQTKAKLCGITKYQPPFIWRETHGRVRTIAFDTQSHSSKVSPKVVHEYKMNSWINELLSSISGVSLDQKCIWLEYVRSDMVVCSTEGAQGTLWVRFLFNHYTADFILYSSQCHPQKVSHRCWPHH